ncbi:hypothetical protein NHX12_017060 [Muraenolepis orangiensis]|uniref:Caspase-1 n=1 Tax=Muraenolepis orangiensis TaxID=630683 RepID=A0A9Q0D9M3_9TELE|nr:hypothetical protein NHX12_017060 [Muraenolepis orangiensis]
MPVIKGLLDDLWQKKVLSTEDKDSVMENQTSKVDRARCLIDMVMGKGERASQMMVDSMKVRDMELCISLGLIPSPLPGMEVSSVQNWSSKLIPSPDILKTEILKHIDDIYPVMAPDARTSPALLITNVHFDNMPLRKGAEKDEQNMENLLTSLGYTVVKYRDLSGVQMDEAIEKFSQDACLPEADSVFVVIMSHGQRGAVLGVRHSGDGEADTLPVDNIYKHLDSARCPGLLNKPKVIIIQACRGALDGSVSVPDGPGSVWNEATCVQVDGSLQPQPEDTEEHIEDDGFRREIKEMLGWLEYRDLLENLERKVKVVSMARKEKWDCRGSRVPLVRKGSERGSRGPKGAKGAGVPQKRSAFSVGISPSKSFPPSGFPIRFDKVFYNEESHYNSTSHSFTCIHSGVYVFSYHITVRNRPLRAALVVNGSRRVRTRDSLYGQDIDQASTLLLLQLVAGDQVWLETMRDWNGAYASSEDDSIFSGFLLYSDEA